MDGFDDIDLGYTPARPVARSLSDIFHRPWDTRQSDRRATTAKAYPQSVDADQLLRQLSDIVTGCAEERNCETVDGMNHTWQCPNRDECDRFWNKVSGKTCARRLTPEMFEQYKAEFEGRVRPK